MAVKWWLIVVCMLVVVFCMNDIVELAVDKQYYQLIQGAL